MNTRAQQKKCTLIVDTFVSFKILQYILISVFLEILRSVSLIDNFVQAVTTVHFEFNWPYPVLINEFKKSIFVYV